MKTLLRVAVGAALAAGALWTIVELKPAARWRAAERAWWS